MTASLLPVDKRRVKDNERRAKRDKRRSKPDQRRSKREKRQSKRHKRRAKRDAVASASHKKQSSPLLRVDKRRVKRDAMHKKQSPLLLPVGEKLSFVEKIDIPSQRTRRSKSTYAFVVSDESSGHLRPRCTSQFDERISASLRSFYESSDSLFEESHDSITIDECLRFAGMVNDFVEEMILRIQWELDETLILDCLFFAFRAWSLRDYILTEISDWIDCEDVLMEELAFILTFDGKNSTRLKRLLTDIYSENESHFDAEFGQTMSEFASYGENLKSAEEIDNGKVLLELWKARRKYVPDIAWYRLFVRTSCVED